MLHLKALEFSSGKRNARKEKLGFDVSIVDSCNLNCVSCAAFSPLCKDVFMEKDVFERDIRRIGELTDGELYRLWLSGGEALQHPQIVEFVRIAREHIKKGEIAIITNGILLNKQSEEFWNTCKDNDIRIYVTPYPIKLKFEQIIETAKKHQVVLEWFSTGDKICFGKLPLNIEGKGSVVKNFKRCANSNTCSLLRDGKFYACARAYSVRYFNDYFGMNFKITEKDYLDIYKVKNLDEMLDYMCTPVPFCRYCDVDNMKFGIKWKISKKEIEEWV